MPSICLVYGLGVAWGGFARPLAGAFRPSAVSLAYITGPGGGAGGAPGSLKVSHGELSHVCPVSVRCRDGGSAMRHGLHRLAQREAAQRWQGGSPRLCANPRHLCLEAVRGRSGIGPGAVPCGPANSAKGSGPALAGRQSQALCKSAASVSGGGQGAVRYWSGGGPMWIAQIPDIKPLAELVICLLVLLSAPCIDGAGTAQARRIPHMDCATHWR